MQLTSQFNSFYNTLCICSSLILSRYKKNLLYFSREMKDAECESIGVSTLERSIFPRKCCFSVLNTVWHYWFLEETDFKQSNKCKKLEQQQKRADRQPEFIMKAGLMEESRSDIVHCL